MLQAFSTPNISRSKEGDISKKPLVPPIFYNFFLPWVDTYHMNKGN